MLKIEYQVRPVVRYNVTRWYSQSEPDNGLAGGGVSTIGEFEGPWHANTVCKALAASEEGATCILVDDVTVPDVAEEATCKPSCFAS